MDNLSNVVSEASVVLPLENEIHNLEDISSELQRSSNISGYKYERGAACEKARGNVTIGTFGVLDGLMGEFTGMQFWKDDALAASVVFVIEAVVDNGTSAFPKPGVRGDLVTFVTELAKFFVKRLQQDSYVDKLKTIAVALVSGCAAATACENMEDTPVDEIVDVEGHSTAQVVVQQVNTSSDTFSTCVDTFPALYLRCIYMSVQNSYGFKWRQWCVSSKVEWAIGSELLAMLQEQW